MGCPALHYPGPGLWTHRVSQPAHLTPSVELSWPASAYCSDQRVEGQGCSGPEWLPLSSRKSKPTTVPELFSRSLSLGDNSAITKDWHRELGWTCLRKLAWKLQSLLPFLRETLSDQVVKIQYSTAMGCPKPEFITEKRSLFSAIFKRGYKKATFIDLPKAFDAINSNLAGIKLHAIDLTSLVWKLFYKWRAKCCNLTDELR